MFTFLVILCLLGVVGLSITVSTMSSTIALLTGVIKLGVLILIAGIAWAGLQAFLARRG